MADSTVYPNVDLGEGTEVQAYAVVGVPPRGRAPGELPTRVGRDSVIRTHAVVYAGNRIGARFQLGHAALVREENEIGDDVSVGTHTVVEHHVVLGDGVRVHSNAFVPEYSRVDAGAWIGPNVVFTNAKYPRSPGVKEALRGPRVHRGAIVGANATLLPGVTIGEGAIVGAGAVVVRDVAPGKVVAGNPARVVRERADLAAYKEAGP